MGGASFKRFAFKQNLAVVESYLNHWSLNLIRCLIQCVCKSVKGRFLNVVETGVKPGCKSNSDCKEGGEICQGGKCLPGCGRNEDCKEEENCQDGSCVDICNPPNAQDGKSPPSPCGTNALCKSIKHRKECSCPPNHLGNPEVECITEKKGRLKSVKELDSVQLCKTQVTPCEKW